MPPIIEALPYIAAAFAVASAVFSVIAIFNPPKPASVTFGYGQSTGPRYGFGPLNNTVSNELPVPVLYGQLKLAGNVIWQTDPGSTVSRIVGLCEGQIQSITDVRANDVVINGTNTPGSDYSTYLGTQTQGADSRLPATLRPDMEMHNLAYISLTLTASDGLKGGNPTITSVVQGLLVETWQNGAWNTTKVYSQNPVACIRDFLINTRYGLGIPKANLNDASFGETSDYCDELVDGPTGKEARYTLNYIIDGQRPAQDIINDMLATFSGFIVYAGNLVKLRVEKPETITQYFGDGSTTKANASFDPGNIVRDSFSWNMASLDDRPNRIRVQWVDPSQNYVKVYTQIEDRIDQDDRNTVITKDIALLGITRQSQASRMAKLMMAVTKYSHFQINFAARLESVHCEVGDVVALTHQSAKFTRRLFRIIQMQEAENETIMFSCREYNASLFDDHQAAAIVTYTQPSGPNLYAALSDVTGLTLIEDNFKQKDGVFATNILASWTAVPGDQLLRLGTQKVQISQDGGTTYRDVVIIGPDKTSYRIVLGNVQTGTTFTVRIKTISDRGAESAGISGDITISGKVTAPSDVADFSVAFAFDHIAMTWSAIDDADLFGYEIRVGDGNSTWETATIVTTENLGTRYDVFNFTIGTKIFFIKAIDNSANYSQNAAQDSIVITSIPQSNVVFTFDIFSRLTTPPHPLEGTLSSSLDRVPTNDYGATYNRVALQPKTAQTHAAIQAAYATNLLFQNSTFKWGREQFVTTQETYETTAIDIGVLTTGAYILDIQTFSSSNLGFVSAQISTSTDDITYTAYKAFVAGQFSARYVKFKFLIQATNAGTKVRLTSAILTIDVPDINQSFLNQQISSAGTIISLTGFTNVKSVVITTVAASSSLVPVITDQSGLPSSFIVKVYDKTDAAQNASCNIWVSGY